MLSLALRLFHLFDYLVNFLCCQSEGFCKGRILKKIVIALMFLLVGSNVNGMIFSRFTKKSPKLKVYAIPGLCGAWLSDPDHCFRDEIDRQYTEYLRNVLQHDELPIITVDAPMCFPDLGQRRCVKNLRREFSEYNLPDAIILYGHSQGCATVLNYLADMDECVAEKIKCVILEAPVLSGNSAIIHTLRRNGGSFLQRIAKLPLSYYWLPYFAKFMFPFYWPAGRQPVKSIDQIPNNIPIIIVHSRYDSQVPYDGSCALYYKLRSSGSNNNVYFIAKDSGDHIQILQNVSEAAVVRSILAKHRILATSDDLAQRIECSAYQPDHRQFKPIYDALIRKENNHVRLKYAAYGLGLGACILAFYKYCLASNFI